MQTRRVLLYDGLCGFCDRVVQFVLARDPAGTMQFAPLQGSFARGVLSRHPEVQGIDSLILVRVEQGRETVCAQSAAVIEILVYLGGLWGVTGATMRVFPRFARDAAYSAFARSRYRLFGQYPACRLPTTEQRARFLD